MYYTHHRVGSSEERGVMSMRGKTIIGVETPRPLPILWNEIYRRMEIANYRPRTIDAYRISFNGLCKFMDDNDLEEYSSLVGEHFLAENQFSNKAQYKALVQHLNLAASDVFWAEHYRTALYEIRDKKLKELHNLLQRSMETATLKEKSKNTSFRCICILDIYLHENGIVGYTPEVGQAFLRCMERVSDFGDKDFARIYRTNIARLNAYYCGEEPYIKRGREYKFYNSELKTNHDILLNRLLEKKHVPHDAYTCILTQLDRYMQNKGYLHYTPQIGDEFLKQYQFRTSDSGRYNGASAVISHFNDVVMGEPYQRHHVKNHNTMPEEFASSYHTFEVVSLEDGNSYNTIRNKASSCTAFFLELKRLGICDIKNITPEAVAESCATLPAYHWSVIRGYLRCCSIHDITSRDYSWLVPYKRSPILIPPYYTKKERQQLEAAPDRTTSIGKRDYAIILIANRLGLRSSDIVSLSFTELQAGKKTIDFEQIKTKIPHSLPFLPEIQFAVEDYVNSGRPESDSDKVFLMSYAPFTPLESDAVYAIVTKSFIQAGVDISNRKHGAHALRASLGTDLVNDGFTYDETRHILGQKDANSTRHYAVLDIKNLRKCARKPCPPKGRFKTDLNIE